MTTLVSTLCMLRRQDNPEAREFVMRHESLALESYEDLTKSSEPLAILSPSLLKRFAHAWDRVVNRGHFPTAAPLLWQGRPAAGPIRVAARFPAQDPKSRSGRFAMRPRTRLRTTFTWVRRCYCRPALGAEASCSCSDRMPTAGGEAPYRSSTTKAACASW